jgi:uncharacterized protein (TIGR03083 family)
VEPADVVPALADERVGLADQLAGLTDSEWAAASLCPGWTARDVLAHLTLTTRLTMLRAVGGMLRARGDVNRMIGDSARSRARAFPPADLIAQLCENAESTRRPPGTQIWDPLVDVLVHGQDILRPLGHVRTMPVERVGPALEHVWSSSFYGPAKRFVGLRFVATDIDWTSGEGDREVRGPAAELLLVATGRPAGLAEAEGPGVEEASARLAR